MNDSATGTLIYLLIGYLCGVVFAPHVFSANIFHTHWQNIWVYAWLLLWPFMLLYHFVWPFFLAALRT